MSNNDKALASIAGEQDLPVIRKWIAAGLRQGDRTVEMAARRRLAQLAPGSEPGTLAHAFWAMVETIEQLRRDQGRTVWRMNYLRRAEKEIGVEGALVTCVRKQREGFREIVGYGLPELTAEAIVLAYPDAFDREILDQAQARLMTLDPPYVVPAKP